MIKIVGYTALHYGKDYLGYAIRSVIDHLDSYVVLYTPVGSHGSRTDVPCPETRDELYAIASAAAGSKLRWFDGQWAYEGQQRDTIYQIAPDADVIVTLDADEIWSDGLVSLAIGAALKSSDVGGWRVPMIHYWRSMYRAVMHDPALPVRVVNVAARQRGAKDTSLMPYREDMPDTTDDIDFNTKLLREMREGKWNDPNMVINHMGYAQRSEIVNYKQLTHGHRGEWRHDVDWFNDKFMANAQHDTHPVGSEYWNPEPIDYRQFMPAFMSEHPYADLTVIP